LIGLAVSSGIVHAGSGKISIILEEKAHGRLHYGASQLKKQLENIGFEVTVGEKAVRNSNVQIWVGTLPGDFIRKQLSVVGVRGDSVGKKEGYLIYSNEKADRIIVAGNDASGALYGCLELAERISDSKKIPSSLFFRDQPEMVMRGTCIGLQKPTYLPGRQVYEYPYTPETFPWFYDRQHWIQVLDSMVANRFNSLYLWNGHPFASLVRLKDYPYAVEVSDDTFKKNEEIFRFLTEEADKRGIWVIQMFYNIIVSKPFAEKHNIKTQDRERPILPLISDYTRKSIAAFVEKYPNVGLMVCLGEAMEGVGNDDIEWFTKTIIPGVKDGLAALGKTEEPPIVLRAHDTDAPAVMKAALPIYKNLYTEAKFNGEALTTYEPRGSWADLHRTLSRIGTVQIENVHILANLEPFRYASADFIQRSVQAMHSIYEANGLHLYPQASYWDWPYSADKSPVRLLQIERDWLWYRQWSRYAWKANRNREEEIVYWSKKIGDAFNAPEKAGREILEAYEQSGQIAPKLLRRFGITDGNRQTLTLGMLMTQLINPYRYGLFTLLYESESPLGEMLIEYAEKEWKNQPHIGETPVQISREVVAHGKLAVEAILRAEAALGKTDEEFSRIKNDIYCYQALAECFAYKATAALKVLRYKYSNDIRDLEEAVEPLRKSVEAYARLTDLTRNTYLYANSMQTAQRKIPIRGVDGTFKTWEECLPVYQRELEIFTQRIDSLKKRTGTEQIVERMPLRQIPVRLHGKASDIVVLQNGASLFSDTAAAIKALAAELQGLRGLKSSVDRQIKEGTIIEFDSKSPVKVLVGYFGSKEKGFLKAPELETNANANEYGQAEIRISNALLMEGWPPVNVHSYAFPAGKNTLALEKGACLILGFVADVSLEKPYDAGLNDPNNREIDWLFE